MSRPASMLPLAPPLVQWDAEASLRAISSSTTTLVQFSVKALASRFAAALFASQAIGANANQRQPRQDTPGKRPRRKRVAARR